MYELQEWLKEIGGFAGGDPAACRRRPGRADRRADHPRLPHDRAAIPSARKILIPDSAHGTNPATSAHERPARWSQLPSDARGNVDLEALRSAVRRHPGRA